MDRRQGVREIDADADHAIDIERPPLAQFLLERLSVDELHPDAHLPLDTLGAIDGHDVRVPDPSEQSAFLDYCRGSSLVITIAAAQQLERHLAVESRIPRPIHVAKTPTADVFEETQRSPEFCWPAIERRQRLGARRNVGRRAGCAIDAGSGDVRDETQLRQQLPVLVAGGRLSSRIPVDGGAVSECCGDLEQRGAIDHASVLQPGA